MKDPPGFQNLTGLEGAELTILVGAAGRVVLVQGIATGNDAQVISLAGFATGVYAMAVTYAGQLLGREKLLVR